MKPTFNSIVKEHMSLAKDFILSIPNIQERAVSMREGVTKAITASMIMRLAQTPETPVELGLALSCYSYLTKVFGADAKYQQRAVRLTQKLLSCNPEAYVEIMKQKDEKLSIEDIDGLEEFLVIVLELSEERSVRKAAAILLKEREVSKSRLAELYLDVLNGLPEELFEEGEEMFKRIVAYRYEARRNTHPNTRST